MKNKTIGIIGFGYVGQAIHYLFQDNNKIKVKEKKIEKY
jgi:lactate dehydrogenase-like 2-hydroxyacid dehydrogenase